MQITITGGCGLRNTRSAKRDAMKIPFGKYEGQELSDVRKDHLEWLHKQIEEEIHTKTALLEAIEEEINLRYWKEDANGEVQ